MKAFKLQKEPQASGGGTGGLPLVGRGLSYLELGDLCCSTRCHHTPSSSHDGPKEDEVIQTLPEASAFQVAFVGKVDQAGPVIMEAGDGFNLWGCKERAEQLSLLPARQRQRLQRNRVPRGWCLTKME